MSEANCIFCKIARGEIPAKIAYEDAEFVAFHDINPGAPTHILIIPRQHIPSLADAESVDPAVLGRMLRAAAMVAKSAGLLPDGYRVVTNVGPHAGQAVFHLHWHILGGREMRWPPG